MSSSVDAGTGGAPCRRTGALGAVARRGGTALVLSVLVNVVVATAARTGEVGTGLQAMTYPSVVGLTVIGVVGATVVYAALVRVSSRPDRTFVVVAVVVLVLSIVPDVTYIPSEPGGSLVAGVVLAAMHVMTAAIVLWQLVDREQVG